MGMVQEPLQCTGLDTIARDEVVGRVLLLRWGRPSTVYLDRCCWTKTSNRCRVDGYLLCVDKDCMDLLSWTGSGEAEGEARWRSLSGHMKGHSSLALPKADKPHNLHFQSEYSCVDTDLPLSSVKSPLVANVRK